MGVPVVACPRLRDLEAMSLDSSHVPSLGEILRDHYTSRSYGMRLPPLSPLRLPTDRPCTDRRAIPGATNLGISAAELLQGDRQGFDLALRLVSLKNSALPQAYLVS